MADYQDSKTHSIFEVPNMPQPLKLLGMAPETTTPDKSNDSVRQMIRYTNLASI